MTPAIGRSAWSLWTGPTARSWPRFAGWPTSRCCRHRDDWALRLRFGIDAERDRADEALVRRASRVAMDRLAGADHLVGGRLSLADITPATMTAPLQYAGHAVRDDPDI